MGIYGLAYSLFHPEGSQSRSGSANILMVLCSHPVTMCDKTFRGGDDPNKGLKGKDSHPGRMA